MQTDRFFTYFMMFISIILSYAVIRYSKESLADSEGCAKIAYSPRKEKLLKAGGIAMALCAFVIIGFFCQGNVPAMMNGRLTFRSGTLKEIRFREHVTGRNTNFYAYNIVLESTDGELTIPYKRDDRETDLEVGEELEVCHAPGETFWIVSRRDGVETPIYKAYYRGYGINNSADRIAVSVILTITVLIHFLIYLRERRKEVWYRIRSLFGLIWILGIGVYSTAMIMAIRGWGEDRVLGYLVQIGFFILSAGEFFYLLADDTFHWVTPKADEEEAWGIHDLQRACEFWGSRMAGAVRDEEKRERSEAEKAVAQLSYILQNNREMAKECLLVLMDDKHISMVRINAAVDAIRLGIWVDEGVDVLKQIAERHGNDCFGGQAEMFLKQWKEYGRVSLYRCPVCKMETISPEKTKQYGTYWEEIWTEGVRTIAAMGAIICVVVIALLKFFLKSRMNWGIIGTSAGLAALVYLTIEIMIRYKAGRYRMAKDQQFEAARVKMGSNTSIELWFQNGDCMLYTFEADYEKGEELIVVYLPKLMKVKAERLEELDPEGVDSIREETGDAECADVTQRADAEAAGEEKEVKEEKIPEDALRLHMINHQDSDKYWKYKYKKTKRNLIIFSLTLALLIVIDFKVGVEELEWFEIIAGLTAYLGLLLAEGVTIWEYRQLRKNRQDMFEIAYFKATGEKKQMIHMLRDNHTVISYEIQAEDELKKGDAVVIYMPQTEEIFVVSREKWRKMMIG